MLRLISIAIAISALVAGCTPAQQQQVADSEAQVLQVIKSIGKGAAVAAADVKGAIDTVCANGAGVNAGVQAVTAVLATQSGPKTTQNINTANNALNALSQVCSQAAANPNDPAMVSLLRTAWNSYQAAKSAQATAASAAAKGT